MDGTGETPMTMTAIDAAATFRDDPAKARSAPTVTATLVNGRARLLATSASSIDSK